MAIWLYCCIIFIVIAIYRTYAFVLDCHMIEYKNIKI